MTSTLRAIALLTGAMLRRLVREGLVLRSLAFPTIIVLGTLVLTIGIVAWVRWSPTIALSPEHADLAPALAAHGLLTRVDDDPREAVAIGAAWGAVEGDTVWLSGGGPHALVVESVLREKVGAPWRPDAEVPKPSGEAGRPMTDGVVIVLAALFALYGVVFGAGMVARDRDNGTLESELALPVPRWVHGVVRLLVGASALSIFLVLGILMVDAVMGVSDVGRSVRHGVACATGATCIGLLVIGRGGLKSGFTGPLTSGMALTTGLVVAGLFAGPVAAWIPIASFASRASGWEALAGTIGLSTLTVWVFTVRSTST